MLSKDPNLGLQLKNGFVGGTVIESGENAVSQPMSTLNYFTHRAQHFID